MFLTCLIFFLFFLSLLSLSSSQPDSQLNMATHFLFDSSPISPITVSPNHPPFSLELSNATPPAPSMASTNGKVAKAVAATAASTLVVAGIFFLFFKRFAIARNRLRKSIDSSFRREEAVAPEEFRQFGGTLKGLIVDENGLDILYLRKLEGGQLQPNFSKVVLDLNEAKEEKKVDARVNRPKDSKPIQEVPLLHEPSDVIALEEVAKPGLQIPTQPPVPQTPHPPHPPCPPVIRVKHTPPPPPPAALPPPLIPPKKLSLQIPTPPPVIAASPPQPPPPKSLQSPCTQPPPVIPVKQAPPPPPPPPPPPVLPKKPGLQIPTLPLVAAALPPQPPPTKPHQPPCPPPPPPPPPVIPAKQAPPPPPLPVLPPKKFPTPPPLPPILAKRNHAPPPSPSKAGGLVSSLKPPTTPRGKPNSNIQANTSAEECSKGPGIGQMKLKPLHWDKVLANADHSMVWDEINNGSFRFDDDLMETLFGYTSNWKSPERNNIASNSISSNSSLPAQIFILEPRKSQNTAIVLKSLAISRKEIVDALLEGQGLDADILEKLTKISPTQEEEANILQFNGNPTKLATAESFLYHILKAVPSAFTRFHAMLFRSNYDPEILHLKESLQTLDLGCKELRAPGIFLKLLEAILKAGNRMNVGTNRGNAQGFNLTALRKLSDVKSTDGKTTLLHFVVEQVVRTEGKRCVVNRNHSLSSCNSQRSKNIDPNSESPAAKEERDKEYLMLGLPALGGLSVEFSNVKKAATIDYDSFINMCSILAARVAEIRQLVTSCSSGENGGFVREMKGFLEECDDELKVVREEQTRVMELVKRTTKYYQAGASNDKGAHPLHLFVIVKDFIDMVDHVCLDIARKLQKKNLTNVGSSSPPSPSTRTTLRVPNLQSHFLTDQSRTTYSSDSEDDF